MVVQEVRRNEELLYGVAMVVIIACFVAAFLLLSGPLTGRVIAEELSTATSALGSLLFFVAGVTGLYLLVHRGG